MSNFIKLIARNTAVLLMTTTYTCKKHYIIANNMVTVLLYSEDITIDILSTLYDNALKLDGRKCEDRKTIQIIRDDIKYLMSIKRGD